ncbi:hypothetical protein AOLI_G00268470 [Acnodon oligacanthus]
MVQVSVGWNSREAKQTRTQHKSSDTNGRSALEEISSTGRTGGCIQWSLTLCPPTFSPDRQTLACAAWARNNSSFQNNTAVSAHCPPPVNRGAHLYYSWGVKHCKCISEGLIHLSYKPPVCGRSEYSK